MADGGDADRDKATMEEGRKDLKEQEGAIRWGRGVRLAQKYGDRATQRTLIRTEAGNRYVDYVRPDEGRMDKEDAARDASRKKTKRNKSGRKSSSR